MESAEPRRREQGDALAGLKQLLERRRSELGYSREMVARMAGRHGVAIDAAFVRHLEVGRRTPPDPATLRAVALVLGLSYAEVTGAVTLGLEEW